MSKVSKDMIEKMITIALDARKNAYNPYYKTYVGACVMDDQENLYAGCNVGNAVGLLDSCAEAIAFGHAIARGAKSFQAIAIVGFETDLITPCGACRQRIAELAPKALIICANAKSEYQVYQLEQLLPHRFELQTKA
ncbi:MAG: cytidine deaminase [Bdellovibrionota bacterium]